MVTLTLSEIKTRSEQAGYPPVSHIIRSVSIKPGLWLHTGFRLVCPECKEVLCGIALYVSLDSEDELVEAMTLWPEANVINPPAGAW